MSTPRRRPPARRPAAKPAAAASAPADVVDIKDDQPAESVDTDDIPSAATDADVVYGTIAGERIDWEAIERDQMKERADLVHDIRSIATTPDIEYKHLLHALAQAGWFFRLREVGAQPHHTGGTLISLAIEIGRGPVHTQIIDQVSLVAPADVLDPSTWARANAPYSVIFLLFNRVPDPKPQSAAAPAAAAAADPATDIDVNAPDWEPLDLVESRTPDGLPILYDPFALGEKPDEIGESVVRILQAEVPEIMGLDALAALYTHNQVVFDFLRETQPARYAAVRELLDQRRDELTPDPAPPRAGGRAPRRA